MREASSDRTGPARLAVELDRYWIRCTLVAWAAIAAWYVFDRWGPIRWFAMGDTDDNMRLMQVRAWLAGQDWYDLRNYRLNPPQGFDIHWSRLVDLPIAALILFFRLFTSNAWAERLAVGIAPLLPLSVVMLGLGATVRRLIHPLAWPLAIGILLFAPATMLMFMPERIDHHGWQLAFLALTVAGLCDPLGRRGGLLVGLATAASLTIGLEMLPYAAMSGAIITLVWVWDRAEAPRLLSYAASLAGGSALGFVLFASNANRVLRCDALTPVWLSVVLGAGALLFAVAWASPASRATRLALAAAAAAAIVAGFALAFPQCLGRPEQVSPELAKNWLNNVKEAKPIYKHAFRLAFPIVALPIVGLVGALWSAFRALRAGGAGPLPHPTAQSGYAAGGRVGERAGTAPRKTGWAAVALFTLFACLMLLWQARAGPAAEMLAIPGAVALGWLLVPLTLGHTSPIVRVLGTAAAVVIVSGSFAGLIITYLPVDRPSPYTKRVNRATGRCLTLPALAALNRYPRTTIFTFIDLGPRLITITHHDAIAGPYHRNGDAILDVQHAFGGAPEQARAIMRRHRATLLAVCPNMAESTIYRARTPAGFYARLAKGEKFPWLTQLPLPKGSPLRLFRIG